MGNFNTTRRGEVGCIEKIPPLTLKCLIDRVPPFKHPHWVVDFFEDLRERRIVEFLFSTCPDRMELCSLRQAHGLDMDDEETLKYTVTFILMLKIKC